MLTQKKYLQENIFTKKKSKRTKIYINILIKKAKRNKEKINMISIKKNKKSLNTCKNKYKI